MTKKVLISLTKIKDRPKGLHKLNTEYYIQATKWFLPTYKVGPRNLCNLCPRYPRLINDLRSTKEFVRKNKLFLQNEPNFQKSQVNVTALLKREYVQLDTWSIRKNEPKTNPNEPKTNPILANKTTIRTQNEPNSNPISRAKNSCARLGSCYNASQKILISQGSERPGVRLGPS